MKIVISLGGSVIVPDEVDINYLKQFKKFIDKMVKSHQIVIVTGGGGTARKYISALEHQNVAKKYLSFLGIAATRLNAKLVSTLFNMGPIPLTMKDLLDIIKKKRLIICGALDFHENMTSDGTAADVAAKLKADLLINITNVKGLYTRDPKKFKNAILIPRITFQHFNELLKKIKFRVGQHFVLDQRAAFLIQHHKIETVIVDSDLKNLKNLMKGKKYVGTLIS